MFKLFLLVQYPEIARVISDMYGEESVRNKDGQLVSKKLLDVNELLKLAKGECFGNGTKKTASIYEISIYKEL